MKKIRKKRKKLLLFSKALILVTLLSLLSFSDISQQGFFMSKAFGDTPRASAIRYKYDAVGNMIGKRIVSGPDVNGDGVPDGLFLQNCPDPNKADSDNDGILDVIEDANGNGFMDIGETDPCYADTDGDGILDGVEDINHNGVVDPGEGNPLVANTDMTDTDGDGLIDYLENLTCTNPNSPDTDGDSLLDSAEDANRNGLFESSAGETNPCLADTDNDGLDDGLESTMCTEPLNPDSDYDNVPDGTEDANHNGVVDSGETDPCVHNTAWLISIIQMLLD